MTRNPEELPEPSEDIRGISPEVYVEILEEVAESEGWDDHNHDFSGDY